MNLVKDEDLPIGMRARQRIAHEIASQYSLEIWNIAINASEKVGGQITGNEALSYMGTIVQDFAAHWIVLMDSIRRADDAGILREDLIKEILNGIVASIGGEVSFEEDVPLPGGIKKLKL